MLHFDVGELRRKIPEDLNSFSVGYVLNVALVVDHFGLKIQRGNLS